MSHHTALEIAAQMSALGASPVGDRAVGPSDPSPSVAAFQASIPGVTPPRPRTTDFVAEAAKRIARQNGWDDAQADDIAAAFDPYMDGYELAKALESHFSWDINARDVDALDGMEAEVSNQHRKACIAWARDNNIQPPLPIGTQTTRGEITGVYQHDGACYLVREPGQPVDSNRRLIVRFEDAKATGGAA